MGLLAIVLGHARQLDLFPKVKKSLAVISLVLVAAGVLNLVILPLEGQFRETYFSENALLAHHAITFFRDSEWDVVRGFKGEINEIRDGQLNEFERNARLSAAFTGSGLPAYTHDWQTSDGLYHGQNIYSIHMASRGPQTEAIVVAAPWLAQNGEVNEGGVALLFALSRFFQRWNFCAKNLIFLVSSNPDVALRDWVDAYHSSLQYTAGSIEGAMVLDYAFESEFFDHVEIGFEGLNGQQPNLDLLNSAIYSVAAEFSDVTILGFESVNTYYERLVSILKHIWHQASAGIRKEQCGSSMFSGWRIDAVTLKAVPGNEYYDITTLGRVCESTLRSINNLLEHFHQSFFFYLMIGPRHFVSIASYLPSGVLISISYSIMAFHMFANKSGFTFSATFKAIYTLFVVFLLAMVGVWSKSAQSALAFWSVFGIIGFCLGKFLQAAEKAVLYSLNLILFGLQLTALSMVNFSLALCIGLVCTPLAWVKPGRSVVFNFFLVSLTCPATVLSIVASGLLDISLTEVLQACIRADNYLNVWTWKVIGLSWIPFWIISIACM